MATTTPPAPQSDLHQHMATASASASSSPSSSYALSRSLCVQECESARARACVSARACKGARCARPCVCSYARSIRSPILRPAIRGHTQLAYPSCIPVCLYKLTLAGSRSSPPIPLSHLVSCFICTFGIISFSPLGSRLFYLYLWDHSFPPLGSRLFTPTFRTSVFHYQ